MIEKQRYAIVTGSSKGFGLALTKLLLEDGWEVLGIARQKPTELGARYKHFASDLSTTQGIRDAEEAIKKFLANAKPKVLLVNNAAALGTIKPLVRLGTEEMNAVVTLNLTAPLALMGTVGRALPKDACLDVVNISTGAAHRPYAGWALYCSTKAALRMASLTVAEEAENRGQNLRMVIYEPGVLDTAMQEQIRRTMAEDFPMLDKFIQLHKTGRLASPESSAEFLFNIIRNEKREKIWEGRYS